MIESRNISATEKAVSEKRAQNMAQPTLVLVELDPAVVIEGVRLDDGYLTEDINTFGAMREVCPSCGGMHLQLVLKQTNVRREHVFCPKCTRCFDMLCADGTTALTIC